MKNTSVTQLSDNVELLVTKESWSFRSVDGKPATVWLRDNNNFIPVKCATTSCKFIAGLHMFTL